MRLFQETTTDKYIYFSPIRFFMGMKKFELIFITRENHFQIKM